MSFSISILVCLKKWDFTNTETVHYFMKLLQNILLKNGFIWMKKVPETGALLKDVIYAYENTHLTKDTQVKILVLLCDIILDEKLIKTYGKNLFHDWIKKLPLMLTRQTISSHALKTFSFLAKQKNQIFLQSFKENSQQILTNLTSIQVIGVTVQFEGKQLIANLFYWNCGRDTKEIQSLLEQINNLSPSLDDDVKLYFNQILLA